MYIGGINKNKILYFDTFNKIPENVMDSEFAEGDYSIGQKEFENALSQIDKFLAGEGTHLQYEKHDVFNQIIIRIIDNKTNQVIKEIPSKKILDMAAKMCEMAGFIVDKKA